MKRSGRNTTIALPTRKARITGSLMILSGIAGVLLGALGLDTFIPSVGAPTVGAFRFVGWMVAAVCLPAGIWLVLLHVDVRIDEEQGALALTRRWLKITRIHVRPLDVMAEVRLTERTQHAGGGSKITLYPVTYQAPGASPLELWSGDQRPLSRTIAWDVARAAGCRFVEAE